MKLWILLAVCLRNIILPCLPVGRSQPCKSTTSRAHRRYYDYAYRFSLFGTILQSRWFTFLAVVIIGFFSLLVIKLQQPLKTVTREIDNLNQKIAEIEKSRSELEELGDYIKSPSYLERQARLKLNYKKPGESAVFVYEKQYTQSPAEIGAAAEPSEILPNWQKWLNYLLDR